QRGAPLRTMLCVLPFTLVCADVLLSCLLKGDATRIFKLLSSLPSLPLLYWIDAASHKFAQFLGLFARRFERNSWPATNAGPPAFAVEAIAKQPAGLIRRC